MLLESVSVSSHLEILNWQSVLNYVFSVPLLFFKLLANAHGLSIRSRQFELSKVFISLFKTAIDTLIVLQLASTHFKK